MSSGALLIRNIRRLWQADPEGTLDWQAGVAMREMSSLQDAWLLCEGGRIAAFGGMASCPQGTFNTYDAEGGDVLPAWVDSHTHLVFARSREEEFRYRLEGLSYAEIAERGGGILNSAARLRDTEEEALYDSALQRLHEVIRQGTGAIEIKSGYGLTLESEMKMLRVIRRLKESGPIPVRATFLAAHALPMAYRQDRDAYIRMVIDEWLPRVAGEGLADYVDVFCEKAFFQPDEMDRILEAALNYGLRGKVHVNQFYSFGGIQTAIAQGALSVDHLEVVTEQDIAAMLASDIYPVLLPSAPFFLQDHYPPARRMIDAGLGVALASDFNPGTSPSGRMPFVLTLACTQMKMLPEEAVHAATINGACAVEWQRELGSISPGKKANLILTRPIPSLAYIPYAFGTDLIHQVFLNGRVF
jgi:imidazolonepropionase